MRKLLVLGMAGCLMSALVAGGLTGGEKKGPNVQDPPKNTSETDTSKAMQALETAQQLINFGRREKHAESLLVAAQILHRTGSRPLNVDRKVTGDGGKEGRTPDNSPKALVTEATKLSTAPHIEALAAATTKLLQEDTRGATGNPRVDGFTVFAGQTINWNPITFRGGERAEVYVDTGTFSRMTLQIIDEFGNVVARDNIPAHYYRCVWYPSFTGSYRIRLTNHDSISFRCGMATN